MAQPLVSIICNAYNQEKYIRDALEGFVNQEADFEYEVLIHDDASTDDTPKIIKEYELRYPEIVKPIYQKENQHSKKISITKQYQLPRVKGEYVAFCEGDDYWTDTHKLQKQVDALTEHPESDICGHRARRVDNNGFVGFTAPKEKDDIIPIEEIILGGGSFIATASLMIRTSAIKEQTPMMAIICLDYTWQLQGSLRGGLVYLNDEMSVYRVMSQGSWTSRMKNNPERRNAHSDRVISMLYAFNEYSKRQYESVINQIIHRIRYRQLQRKGDYNAMLSPEFKDLFHNHSIGYKMYVFLRYYFNRIKGKEYGKQ